MKKRNLLVHALLLGPIFTLISCGCNKNIDSKEYCTVTFYAGDGYFIGDETQENTKIVQVEKGNTVDRPLNPIKSGEYEFDGWYCNADLIDEYNFSNIVSNDINLYAGYNFVGKEPFYFEIASEDENGESIASISFSTYDDENNLIDFSNIRYYVGTSYEFANWQPYTESKEITFMEGQKLYIIADERSWQYAKIDYDNDDNLGYNIGGNIMSLLDKTNYATKKDFQGQQNVFNGLFCNKNDQTNGQQLKDASNLKLPAEILTVGCYESMFLGCKNLKFGPAPIADSKQISYPDRACLRMFENCNKLESLAYGFVNASNVGDYALSDMFSLCANLKNIDGFQIGSSNGRIGEYGCERMFMGDFAIKNQLDLGKLLPATTLADYCYHLMFSSCWYITITGSLPATTLAPYCYASMFSDASSIIEIKDIAEILPATNLAEACYMQMFNQSHNLKNIGGQLPATTLTSSCYYYMFAKCDYLKTVDPLLLSKPAELSASCYCQMFRDCERLENAPILPYRFTDIETYKNYDGCYSAMFTNCYNLKEIEVGFSEFPHNDSGQEEGYTYTSQWFRMTNEPTTSIERTFKWRGGTNLEEIPCRDSTTSTLPSSLNWKLVSVN